MSTSNKIRVLHLFANLNLGGAESRIMDLYRSQEKSDVINDFVIMTDTKCYFTDEVLNTKGTIHIIENPQVNLIRTLWNLFVLLRKSPKYNAIHSHTSYFSGIVVFIAWLAGIKKRVTHARNQSLGHLQKKKGFSFKLGQSLCNHFATKKLAISSCAGDFLYGNNDYFVVPNAFEFSRIIHVSNYQRSKLQNDFNIDPTIINIVMIARFNEVKNHQHIVKIANVLKKNTLNFCFHFIGDGKLLKPIKQKIKEDNITPFFRFWGTRNDVKDIIHLFDIKIMPSISEGLGVSALEAQAAGLPCILSTGIPKEADIGINLCQFIDLDDSVQSWASAIIKMSKIPYPDKDIIDNTFRDRGFTIESCRKTYRDCYL